jgi:hypothetical protein
MTFSGFLALKSHLIVLKNRLISYFDHLSNTVKFDHANLYSKLKTSKISLKDIISHFLIIKISSIFP